MAKILIALDDGHGMHTPGKRSPKMSDGTVMLENEFNRRVVALLDKELKRCGFATILVAPTDEDVPLAERVSRANKAKANFYLSVHANAFNAKLDNKAGGIETFAHFSYPKTVAKARIIHKWVMKGSKMKDRGVKNGDWLYVCQKTAMEAVLTELGFMDNIDDLKLLMSDSYRKECAVELAQALCEIYNYKYVPEVSQEKKTAPIPSSKGTYTIRKGDTFWGIENRLELPNGTLDKLNPSVDAKNLKVGQVIKTGEESEDRYMFKTGWFREGTKGLYEMEKYLKDHGWDYVKVKEK